MKRRTMTSWMMMVMGLLISLIYFFLFSYKKITILGGGTLSLLLLPFVGFLSLAAKKFIRLFVLIFVFLCGHVAINHLVSSFLMKNSNLNLFIAVYIGLWSSLLELGPLLFLAYAFFKPIGKEQDELFCLKQNLRYLPGIILMFVIGYGIQIGMTLISNEQLPPLFSFLMTFLFCFVLLLPLTSFFLLRLPNPVIGLLMVSERFQHIKKANAIFILSLVSFILLSAWAELARGYWLFWSLNTFAITATLVGQWKFIRILFLERAETQQEPQSFYFPQIWSLRFLVWNLAIYFIVTIILVFI